jgi:hypothetical protein
MEGQRGAERRGQKAVWIPLITCELTVLYSTVHGLLNHAKDGMKVSGNISATDEKIIFPIVYDKIFQ